MMVNMKPTAGTYARCRSTPSERGTAEVDRSNLAIKQVDASRILPVAPTQPDQSVQASLAAVVSDGFNRATFHRLFAEAFFFRRLRLFVDVRMTAVVVAFEIRRRSFAAQIAVDALLIDVEFTGCVFGIFVGDVGHDFVR